VIDVNLRILTHAVALGGVLLSTSAGAVPVLPTGFVDSLVVPGLSQPVGMAWLPDGRLLVIEQTTANARLVVGDMVGAPVFTVPEVNTAGLERGLLGVAVDPGFPERPYVYFFLSHAGTPPTNWIVRYTATGDLADGTSTNLQLDPTTGVPILTDIPDQASNHNAGTLRFGPDGLLYASLGDDGDRCAAQLPGSLHGAILRLDVSGVGTDAPAKSALVPAGNPFAGPDDDTRLTIAFGLRNPFRIQIDRTSGRLLIADVGDAAFEEVDVLEPDALGQNFGWPLHEGPSVTATTCPGISDAGPFGEPVASYGRTGLGLAAIIAAGVYHGVAYPADRSFPPEYEGDAFFAEYYGGFLRRLHRNADGSWTPAAPVPGQPTPTDWAQGLSTTSDFSLGPDGALYYVSQFGNGGSLHRIAFAPDVVLRAGEVAAQPGTDAAVTVRTSAAIEVGSSDVRLRFDPAVLQATSVTSTLDGFDFTIDNPAGTVTTASASGAGQVLAANDALFTVVFHVAATAAGCSTVGVEDADGTPPDDLAGPAPPLPPRTIAYTAAAGRVCTPACGNGIVEPGEDCDDGNLAGGDCCDAGCRFEAADTACPEAPCAVGRSCDGQGLCGGGTLRSCDDGNLCTDDACDARSGCVHVFNAAPCDDGDACTANDACANGVCTGSAAAACDDGNPCTDDGCDPAHGCTHTPNTAACTDGNACTTGDACLNGACVPGGPRTCDDGNPCTVDGCVPATGCTATAVEDGTACPDDGSACTADRCIAGACAHPSAVDCTALGDADCDGRGATPIDAQAIRCLGVGRCQDADVPSPCDDATVRRARSDWNLDGVLDGSDAANALAVFVGRLRAADTALGACCPLSIP
jgi:cysteine-rich repeat protein